MKSAASVSIVNVAAAADVSVSTVSKALADSPEISAGTLQMLLEHGVYGIVALAANTNHRPALGHDLGAPVVYAYGPSTDPRDYSVIPDEAQGAVLAVRHFRRHGNV